MKNIGKDETELVFQVNGKIRDRIEWILIFRKKTLKSALESEKVKPFIKGKNIIKVVYVKSRLVNIVVK